MFKKRKRKIAVALTAAILLGSVCTGNVGAASSVSGSIGGYSCSGSVTIGVSNASATTRFGTLTYVYARVEYVTRSGGKYYVDTKTEENYAYSVTAVANKSTAGTTSHSATGRHRITYGSYNWTPNDTFIQY